MLNKFTDGTRIVADPLFSKEYLITDPFEHSSDVRHADWFDAECEMAHGHYVSLFNQFNCNNSEANRR